MPCAKRIKKCRARRAEKARNLQNLYAQLERRLGHPATDEEMAEALGSTLMNSIRFSTKRAAPAWYRWMTC